MKENDSELRLPPKELTYRVLMERSAQIKSKDLIDVICELSSDNELMCPYCGHEFEETYELGYDWEGGSGEVECPECEREFRWELDIIRRWTAHKCGEE